MNSNQEISKSICELSALLLTILRSHPGSGAPPPLQQAMTISNRLTPAAFASLMLGVSLAMMLCGSVTFVIGFILMPWVLGFVMILYFFGILSNFSEFGKAIFGNCFDSDVISPKEINGNLFSKSL